jgi:hypothetical protein
MRRWMILLWSAAVFGSLALSVAFPPPGAGDSRPWAAGLMAFPVASALVLMHRPRNPVGLLLGVVSAAAGILFIGGWLETTFPGDWGRYLEAVQGGVVVVQFWAILSLLYVFPSGLPEAAWTRLGYRLFTAWAVVMAALGVVRPGALDVSGRDNPLGLGPAWLSALFDAGIVVLPIGALVGVGVLVHRRRRADVVERAQLKWFESGAALVLAVMVVIAFVPEGTADAFTFAIVVGGFWGLPAAIVIAVLRYRLFEIDRLISRTFAYAIVLGTLAVVYAGMVFLVSSLLPRQGELAVAVSTLAVAGLFRPVLARTRQAIDRRFNRPRYDREREVGRFAERVRDDIGLDDLTANLLSVAGHTMQPASAGVWLRPPSHDPGSGAGETLEALTVTGEPEVVTRFRALVAEATQ